MGSDQHFRLLFRKLEWMHGALDKDTLASVVGFNGGGPVSMCTLASKSIYVTCELSLYPQQKPSAEGLKYEFLSTGSFDENTCLSMNEHLGDGHTVDVRSVVKSGRLTQVKLQLFSECKIGNGRFGVYQVLPTS